MAARLSRVTCCNGGYSLSATLRDLPVLTVTLVRAGGGGGGGGLKLGWWFGNGRQLDALWQHAGILTLVYQGPFSAVHRVESLLGGHALTVESNGFLLSRNVFREERCEIHLLLCFNMTKCSLENCLLPSILRMIDICTFSKLNKVMFMSSKFLSRGHCGEPFLKTA